MISWISNLIQKRGKVIFSVLLFIIIIAFVFTIGAGPGLVSSDKANYQRDFYGVDLNSAGDMQGLQNATMVSRYVNGVRQYDENQFQQQMLYRQVRLHLAEQLSVPNPTEKELAEFIKTKPAFMDANGKFDKSLFEGFVTSLKGGASMNDAFVAQTIKDDYRLQQVDLLMGAPGFVSEAEVTASVARQETTWNVEIAKSEFSAFNPTIEMTDEAIAEFYANNQLRYEIPEEFTISFVEFSAENVKGAVESPTDEELQRYFLSNRANFAAAEKDITPEAVEGEEATELAPLEIFEKIKNEVNSQWVTEQKTGQAIVLANDFTGNIFDNEIPYQSIQFKKDLLQYGLKLKSLPPFSVRPETQMIGVVPAELYQNAMRLGKDRYFTDVIPSKDGNKFLIGFLESKTDSRIPELNEVKPVVERDYKAEQKTAKFSEHGIALTAGIREKLTTGDTFEAIAGSESLTYENPEAFKLTSQPENIPFQLLQTIEELKSGEITEMIRIGDTGYIAYVNEKQIPEINKDAENYSNILKGLNSYGGMTRYQALIEDMIAKQLSPEA